MAVHFAVNEHTRSRSFFVGRGTFNILDIQFDTQYLLRFSVLPALSLNGILVVKIIEGSFNSDSFKDFI
jgi:hypothetical protein